MILLTGATGYIGGRLLGRLWAEGHTIRCLCRNPAVLAGRVRKGIEAVPGDLLDRNSLVESMRDVRIAFYLVHSMGEPGAFEEQEREAARNFGEAAKAAGVERIIYLGGLAQDDQLSPHLSSRMETGDLLRRSGVPVIEFRASIVIGSGSASFEMIRALVERLPVMITPRWVNTAAQPIAIEDLLAYLMAAISLPGPASRVFEIGGAEQESYAGIMREYAKQRGLQRWIIRVPLLTPSLSSRWLTLITPVHARIGRRLIESVKHPSIVLDRSALKVFPIRPMGVRRAITRALANEDRQFAETRWSDALSSSGLAVLAAGQTGGHRIVESRSIQVPVPPEQAFRPIRRIGGTAGWHYANWLWRVRGLLDLVAGGVGMRRGRPDPEHPLPGSTLDFWRVEVYEPDSRLRLSAEMKVPGRAWLEFTVKPEGMGSLIRQTAEFEPRGLTGLLYWYALYPIHKVMFRGMLRRLALAAERREADRAEPRPQRGFHQA